MTYDIEVFYSHAPKCFCGITLRLSCQNVIATPQLELRVRGQFENVLGASILVRPNLLFNIHPLINYLFVANRSWRRPSGQLRAMVSRLRPTVKNDFDERALASVAYSLLMTVLWAARLARPDLLRAVNYLATKVSKWTSKCDSMMHRLMGYIQATLHLRMIGWIGDSLDKLFPHFFADADFAADIDTQRLTSSFFSVIRGRIRRFRFPLAASGNLVCLTQHLRRNW